MRKKIRSKKFGVIGSSTYTGNPSPVLEKFITKMAEKAYEQTSNNVSQAGAIENYVFNLLRQHTRYLIKELALNQYPENVLHETTEKFINSL